MAPVATLAIAIALLLDLVVGEPPGRLHPVAWFGRLVGRFDREFRNPSAVGLAVALLLPLAAGTLVAAIVEAVLRIHPLVAGLVAGALLFTTVSLRMLVSVGATVIEQSQTDPNAARETVVSLVGRDTESLSPAEIRSAAVESVAENLADGLVGPLFAFALGALVSLPVATGAAAWVKAVNTLDSMLGYPDKPIGTASARLDDLVAWIPARLSAVLIALVALDPTVLGRARRWAHVPASPNSGWPMAAAAVATGVRLEKPGAYTLQPDASLPSVASATRGIRLVGIAGLLAFGLAGVGVWF
jgi:adenosylcobinamide-phosphate synthase